MKLHDLCCVIMARAEQALIASCPDTNEGVVNGPEREENFAGGHNVEIKRVYTRNNDRYGMDYRLYYRKV